MADQREQQIRERYTPAVLDDIERHPHNIGAKEVREFVVLARALAAAREREDGWRAEMGRLKGSHRQALAERDAEVEKTWAAKRDAEASAGTLALALAAAREDVERLRRQNKTSSDDWTQRTAAMQSELERRRRLMSEAWKWYTENRERIGHYGSEFDRSYMASLLGELESTREETEGLREAWDTDSRANMAVILLLRALAHECAEWRDGLPVELVENCEAAARSDWDYLRRRYPDPEAALAREDGG